MSESDSSKPSGRLRRILGAVGRAALLPVRGVGYLVRSGQAHQHFFLPDLFLILTCMCTLKGIQVTANQIYIFLSSRKKFFFGKACTF